MIYIDSMPKNSIIAIDEYNKDTVSGEIRGMYTNKNIKFCGYANIIKTIFPQDNNIKQTSQAYISKEKFHIESSNNKGKIGTFAVELIEIDEFWLRGKVTWIEGKKTEYFRSELELINLISQVAENHKADN